MQIKLEERGAETQRDVEASGRFSQQPCRSALILIMLASSGARWRARLTSSSASSRLYQSCRRLCSLPPSELNPHTHKTSRIAFASLRFTTHDTIPQYLFIISHAHNLTSQWQPQECPSPTRLHQPWAMPKSSHSNTRTHNYNPSTWPLLC